MTESAPGATLAGHCGFGPGQNGGKAAVEKPGFVPFGGTPFDRGGCL